MNDLTEMWRELERYQPFAERRGFGEAWLRMTTERTEEAATAAMFASAAWYTEWDPSWDAEWDASTAAEFAAYAAETAEWAQLAVERIRDAIEQEEPL